MDAAVAAAALNYQSLVRSASMSYANSASAAATATQASAASSAASHLLHTSGQLPWTTVDEAVLRTAALAFADHQQTFAEQV